MEQLNTKEYEKTTFTLSVAPSLAVLTGGDVLTYTSAIGERFTRSSLGPNTSIHS